MSRNKKVISLLIVSLLASVSLAMAAGSSEPVNGLRGARPSQPTVKAPTPEPQELRMPGRMDTVPVELRGQNGLWVAPQSDRSALDDPAEFWVDDSWTDQASVDLFDDGLTWAVDAFATIQQAIDASVAGDIINVLPGSYTEAATNRYVLAPSGQGPHQFGLFIDLNHNNLTVRGVDAIGSPITSYSAVAAHVGLNASNNFGPSGMWVEGDGVTVTGLDLFETGTYGYNKTVEVIGDNFTIQYCTLTDGASLYLNDWRYDTINDISHVQSYLIDGNQFTLGTSVDIASGAGYSGPTSGRVITNNVFDLGGGNWNGISFNGSGTGVEWFVYSVGGAEITGNSFSNGTLQYVRARGTYNNSQFDWQSYFEDNTFDRSAIVVNGGNWPNSVRTWSYVSGTYTFSDVRRIGATITEEVNHALDGDLVLVGPGTYAEWDIPVDNAITVRGAGATTIVDAASYVPADNSHNVFAITAPAGDVTIEDLAINSGQINGIYSRYNMDAGAEITIDSVDIEGNGYNSDPYPGEDFAIIAGYGQTAAVVVSNCTLHDTYQNVMLFERQLGETNIHHNTITDAYTVFYMTYGGDDVAELQKFHHNTLSGGEIYFNSASQYFAPTTAGKYEDIEVSDNTFNNIVDGMRAMGAGNDNGVTPADGEIVAPRFLRNTVNGVGGGTNFRGLQLLGYITNARVENNYIHGVAEGIRVWQFYTPDVFPVDTKIYRNAITTCGVKAVRWDGPGDINASVNWWGAAPVWAGLFTGSVDYTPWCLLDGTYNNPGFTPNLSQLQVEALSPQTGLVNRVQEGVNETVGSTVNLSAGTFVGQVHIALNNLNLVGAGVASTTVKADPVAMALADGAGAKAVIFVDNASNVHVTDMTVDGDNQVAVNGTEAGISYWNSDGLIEDVDVVNLTGGTFGSNYGLGIFADNNDVPAHALTLNSVNASGYQDQGVTLRGSGLTSTMNDVTATGGSVVYYQVGIEIGDGVSADLTNCATATNGDPAYWWGIGCLVNGQADLLNMSSTNELYAILFWDGDGTCTVDNATVSQSMDGAAGIVAYNTPAAAPNRAGGLRSGLRPTLTRVQNLASRMPIAHEAGERLDNAMTLIITNSELDFTAPPVSYSEAITSYCEDSPIDLQISNCTANGYEWGMGGQSDGGSGTTSITNCSVTGNGAFGGIWMWATNYYSPSSQAGTFAGNTVSGSTGRGCELNEFGVGTVTATITDNIFATPDNTFDDHGTVVAGRWDSNCYSDYGPAHGGFPDYNIGGGVQVDLNPNANGCADVDFVTTSDVIGCPGGCANDTLYIRFDPAGYYSGQLILQLPAGLSSYLLPTMSEAAPALLDPLRTANLQHTYARSLPSNQIELNPIWGAGSPSVSDGKFFACIPVLNASSVHGQTLVVTPVSYDFADADGEHTTDLFIGTATLTVDCDDPSATLAGGAGEAGCNAYNSQADFLTQLNYTMAAAGLNGPPVSPLGSAFMTLNGGAPYTLALADGAFPVGSELPNVWGAMIEGCNTFDLHVLDTECNETVVSVDSVVKDTQAPAPSAAYTQSACYNDIIGDAQYGATLLDGDLDIDLAAALACQASTFSLSFTVNTIPVAEGLSAVASITDYPFGSHAQNLWDDIIGVIGTGYSGAVTIGWTVTDCAGNAAIGSFSIPCVDSDAPDNEFIAFDARPTYNGVWLKWTWAAGASSATAMEVWRKGEGDYPVYSGNLSMSDANYEKVHANLVANGWTLAASQAAPNFTAAAYPGTHHTDGVLGTYWKDSIDDSLARDIYRYVTFVRDTAGNWSNLSVPPPTAYTLLTNADRSTNYWLGDFSLHSTNPPGSQGVVEGVDLGLLSAHYFESVGPAPSYLDIGPENHENAYGKGIPNPNQLIDFFDLLPFSYNYGVAGQTGFSVQTPSSAPFDQLDAAPVVSVTRANPDALLEVGSVFDVVVTLSGNEAHAVKVAEAQLEFDPEVLELVAVTAGEVDVFDGVPWSKACAVPGQPNHIGAAVAAMGEIATINGDVTMATIQFRWKAERVGATGIRVLATHIADAYGHVVDGEASALNIGATGMIPTAYALYQNYPNPFNPSTLIRFDLPEGANVQLVIYNVMGQEVRTLVSGNMPAGAHHLTWDGLSNEGRAVGSGLYIYRIRANTFAGTHKMLLAR